MPEILRGQGALAELANGNILLIAPAGCGKTQALALRAHALLKRGEVKPPRKVLGLTFSNKARDNLADRLSQVVGPFWRDRITVANFHGIAARILRAHGTAIQLNVDFNTTDKPWHRKCLRELGINYFKEEDFTRVLRDAKNGPFDNATVLLRLQETGLSEALSYEKRLQSEGRLDYDDLLRHLARLLQIPAVASLYQNHFAATLVDEIQDLSQLQYSIVKGLGGNLVTYAGDPAQGIYAFAGAEPDVIFPAVRASSPNVVELTESYRSAPRVLGVLNSLAGRLGTTPLTSARPMAWPDEGHAIYLESSNTIAEARFLTDVVRRQQTKYPGSTFGIIARIGNRLDHLRNELQTSEVHYLDWSLPVHNPRIVQLLKRHLKEAEAGSDNPTSSLEALSLLCQASIGAADPSTSDELSNAIASLGETVEQGISLHDAVNRSRSNARPDAAVGPGVHLLNGHQGKGQEFDWAAVVGLEDGHIPHWKSKDLSEELRVLHVMLSRAKHGLVFTYAKARQTNEGWIATKPSRWLSQLTSAATSKRRA